MELEVHTDLFSIIIILGVVQGLFLSVFFLNKRIRKKPSNRFLGFLMISLSLIILEIFLNYTNYITRIIYLDNFSEPLIFALGPLFYIYVRTSHTQEFNKRQYWHLLPFFLYLAYSTFQHIQPLEYHHFSFQSVYHPELNPVRPVMKISDDPLGLRQYINELGGTHVFLYIGSSLFYIAKALRKNGLGFLAKGHRPLSFLRNLALELIFLLLVFLVVKLSFVEDLGDHFIASFISLIIYLTSFSIIRSSDFFRENLSAAIHEKQKYARSSLTEEMKEDILSRISVLIEQEKQYRDNLISLPKLARKLSVPSHHISQVINEKLELTFFEYIARYRIQEAARMLQDSSLQHLTVDDIAYEVGYNSKSAFNRKFKSITGKTPSRYRQS